MSYLHQKNAYIDKFSNFVLIDLFLTFETPEFDPL